MNNPTSKTVNDPTNGTLELINIILVDAPSATVRRPTVERVVDSAFRLLDRFCKMCLVQFLADKSFNFALLYNTFTAVYGVTVRATYRSILTVLDRADQTLFAERMQTITQHNAFVRLERTEADRTLERFNVRNQIRIIEID